MDSSTREFQTVSGHNIKNSGVNLNHQLLKCLLQVWQDMSQKLLCQDSYQKVVMSIQKETGQREMKMATSWLTMMTIDRLTCKLATQSTMMWGSLWVMLEHRKMKWFSLTLARDMETTTMIELWKHTHNVQCVSQRESLSSMTWTTSLHMSTHLGRYRAIRKSAPDLAVIQVYCTSEWTIICPTGQIEKRDGSSRTTVPQIRSSKWNTSTPHATLFWVKLHNLYSCLALLQFYLL